MRAGRTAPAMRMLCGNGACSPAGTPDAGSSGGKGCKCREGGSGCVHLHVELVLVLGRGAVAAADEEASPPQQGRLLRAADALQLHQPHLMALKGTSRARGSPVGSPGADFRMKILRGRRRPHQPSAATATLVRVAAEALNENPSTVCSSAQQSSHTDAGTSACCNVCGCAALRAPEYTSPGCD